MKGKIEIELADNGIIIRDDNDNLIVKEADTASVESIAAEAGKVVGETILTDWLDDENLACEIMITYEIKERK